MKKCGIVCLETKMKNYSETDWGDFVSRLNPDDHVHLSAVILLPGNESNHKIGQRGTSPILLVKNSDVPNRKSIKFPGTSFEYDLNSSLDQTHQFEEGLKLFGFAENQYLNIVNYFLRQDENVSRFDKKQQLAYMMNKKLILGVLLKTGYLVSLEEKPFYLDFIDNEINSEFKSFRLFFEAVSCIGPQDLSNKYFFELSKRSVFLFKPEDYMEIAKAFRNYEKGSLYNIKSSLILNGKLRDYIYSNHRKPLTRFIYR